MRLAHRRVQAGSEGRLICPGSYAHRSRRRGFDPLRPLSSQTLSIGGTHQNRKYMRRLWGRSNLDRGDFVPAEPPSRPRSRPSARAQGAPSLAEGRGPLRPTPLGRAHVASLVRDRYLSVLPRFSRLPSLSWGLRPRRRLRAEGASARLTEARPNFLAERRRPLGCSRDRARALGSS